jgi:hypothetical protein
MIRRDYTYRWFFTKPWSAGPRHSTRTGRGFRNGDVSFLRELNKKKIASRFLMPPWCWWRRDLTVVYGTIEKSDCSPRTPLDPPLGLRYLERTSGGRSAKIISYKCIVQKNASRLSYDDIITHTFSRHMHTNGECGVILTTVFLCSTA